MASQMRSDGILGGGCFGLQAAEENNQDLEKTPENGYSGRYKDDLTGQVLKDELVRAARAQELGYFAQKGVWEKRPRQECYEKTKKSPISVRWVDVNKQDDFNPTYRSRLVARQMKALDKSGACYFAPTPPIEALRTVLSLAVTEIGEWKPCLEPESPERTQLSFLDVSRAYFNAKTDPDQPCYVELP
jgi:hypothetical protein